MNLLRSLLALLCLTGFAHAETQILWVGEAATVRVGPFVDDTDGKTAETGLTISQSDVRLSKNGEAAAQKNQSSSATHDENGYYRVQINATDTNTAGTLRVSVNESGALPVWQDFQVLAPEPGKLYVSKSGSDSNNGYSWATAKLTLPAAKTAASAGTTVYVGPGTYALSASDNLAKAGVSWHGDEHAHITSPDDIGAARYIFDDGGNAMVYSVTGFGSITNGDGDAAASEDRSGIFQTSNAASVLTVKVGRLTAYDNQLFGPAGTVATCTAGTQFIQAQEIYGANEAVYCDGGVQYIDADHFDKTPGSTFDQTAFLCDDGEQHINVRRVAGLTGDTFHANGTGKQFITADDVEGSHDSLTCIGASAVQHAKIRRLTGGVYHAGGDQRIHVDVLASEEYCVYLTGSDAGTLTLSGGSFTADTGDAAFDVRTTNANRRVVLLSGSFKGPTNAISAVAAVTQTIEVHGPVTFDGAIDSDVTITSATRQAVRSSDLSGNAIATASSISGLNNLSSAQAQSAAAAALTAYDPPTHAELTSGLSPLATSSALSTVGTNVSTAVTQTTASAIRTGVGLASANLDTQLGSKASQSSVDALGSPLQSGDYTAPLDATATQAAAEAAIEAKLPDGTTQIAAAGEDAKTLDEVEGGGGSGTVLPATARIPRKARWRTLSSRGDRLIWDNPYIDLMPGEQGTYLVRLASWGAEAEPVDGFEQPVSSAPSSVEVLDNPEGQAGRYWGISASGPVFTVQAADDATVGATVTITLSITDGDDVLPPRLTVRIVSPAAEGDE